MFPTCHYHLLFRLGQLCPQILCGPKCPFPDQSYVPRSKRYPVTSLFGSGCLTESRAAKGQVCEALGSPVSEETAVCASSGLCALALPTALQCQALDLCLYLYRNIFKNADAQ